MANKMMEKKWIISNAGVRFKCWQQLCSLWRRREKCRKLDASECERYSFCTVHVISHERHTHYDVKENRITIPSHFAHRMSTIRSIWVSFQFFHFWAVSKRRREREREKKTSFGVKTKEWRTHYDLSCRCRHLNDVYL